MCAGGAWHRLPSIHTEEEKEGRCTISDRFILAATAAAAANTDNTTNTANASDAADATDTTGATDVRATSTLRLS